jgi:hypothetical protein
MISCMLISERTIFPDVPQRMKIESSILGGTMEPPYQYRVMKPVIGNLLQSALSPFIGDEVLRHAFSYQVMIFFVFLGVYFLLYKYLRIFFTENTCILGLLLLQVVIPLGISSIWEEGDYITLLLYLVGLNLMFTGKEKFLPVVIAVGVFNRDQIVYILFLYAAYLLYEGRIKDKKAYLNAAICVVVWLAGYLLLRNIFGFKESVYTIKHNVTTNINTWKSIAELWIAMISVFAFLSIISYKRSNKFFRFALLSLIPYVMIYFLLAIVSQLAKFLPAFLMMIPMSLQVLTNEFTGESQAESERSQAL